MKALTFPSCGYRTVATWCSALALTLGLIACGGGGDSSTPTNPVASNSTGISQGTIAGFGSIIVNGVRYDDSSASVSYTDDDDNGGRRRDDLRLGMVVTINGSSGTATGTATAISFGSELKGPVRSMSMPQSTSSTVASASQTQTLNILGQQVEINQRTVFDSVSLPNGYADIRVGQVLEIHGLLDVAANKLLATRIERENNANKYKIVGNINSANLTSKTFKIGSETIQYGATEVKRLRAAIVDGATVRVTLATTPAGTDTWNATRIVSKQRFVGSLVRFEVEGIITAYTSAAQFSIGTLNINASNATFPRGNTGLGLGSRVEVKGQLVNDVFVATSVKIENRGNVSPSNNEDNDQIELHGAISNLNTTDKIFTLRGLQVSYAGVVTYRKGTASNLVNGVKVEVKATLTGTGTALQAQRISFED